MTENVYTVYHGTNLFAANLINHYGVILEVQRLFTDFGKGFYVTFNWKQAVRWANVRASNFQISGKLLGKISFSQTDYLNHPYARIPAVIAWDINIKDLLGLKGKIFPSPHHHDWKKYKSAWEDFVLKCRNGYPHEYDFVYGPIAGGHFKNEEKIQVSRAKEQLSLHNNKAIACLLNLRIYSEVHENVRKHKQVLLLHQEIKEASKKLHGLKREYADQLLQESWVSSLHPSILTHESPYYWAFCLSKGKEALWHDAYEKWCMENLRI